MIQQNKEPEKEPEEGSAKITLEDVYKMFYVLLKQNQKQHPGGQLSFDLKVFKTLPKKLNINFERRTGRLFVWIPEKPKDRKKPKKSPLYIPKDRIITLN